MKEQIIGILAFGLVIIADIFISLGIMRGLAKVFASPNPYTWEFAYVSESPYATKYHETRECKYLKQTTYNIDMIDVDDAETEGLTPCKHCLKSSTSKQYDEYAAILTFPVFCLLLWGIDKTEKLFKNYTLRNPIVRKT